MNKLAQGCIAEFIGTFGLVFFGVLSIVMTHSGYGAGNLVTVALAHGLILSIGVTACMYISGGQFNPAVSIALTVIGKQGAAQAAAFVVSQLAGAVVAAALVRFIVSPEIVGDVRLGATIGTLTDAGNVTGVLVTEIVLTFFLMFAILMGTVDERAHKLGGFVIGLTVAACILAAGPLTGASMNPARTLGPAFVGNHWAMHWVYWAGPVVGACAAAFLYKAVWVARSR